MGLWLGSQGKELSDKEGTLVEKFVGLGYKQVYGSAEVWGDGITPVPVGSLDGAKCVDIDGVYHSPLGASEDRPWYGSTEILDEWVDFLAPPRANKFAATVSNGRKKFLGLF